MHVCMMHVSMIIDPHACVFDACMMPLSMMRLKFCDGRTDGQGPLILMHVCMMHTSMINDPDYDGYINDSLSLTLVLICMYTRCKYI